MREVKEKEFLSNPIKYFSAEPLEPCHSLKTLLVSADDETHQLNVLLALLWTCTIKAESKSKSITWFLWSKQSHHLTNNSYHSCCWRLLLPHLKIRTIAVTNRSEQFSVCDNTNICCIQMTIISSHHRRYRTVPGQGENIERQNWSYSQTDSEHVINDDEDWDERVEQNAVVCLVLGWSTTVSSSLYYRHRKRYHRDAS